MPGAVRGAWFVGAMTIVGASASMVTGMPVRGARAATSAAAPAVASAAPTSAASSSAASSSAASTGAPGSTLDVPALIAKRRQGLSLPTFLVASGGIATVVSGAYRGSAGNAGYNTRDARLSYEGELGLLHAFWPNLSLGGVVRLHAGALGSPYDPVPAIGYQLLSIGPRAELMLSTLPHLYLWIDPSIGFAWIGSRGESRALPAWGVRAGVALGTARNDYRSLFYELRLRLGYSISSTYESVTREAGMMAFGGFLVSLDGVIRVLD